MCANLPNCDSQAIECPNCADDIMVGSCEPGVCIACGYEPMGEYEPDEDIFDNDPHGSWVDYLNY